MRKDSKKTPLTVAAIVGELTSLIRFEPTCIKCECTTYNACNEGCSWVFLNKKTNEGVCSVCFDRLNASVYGR